MLALPRHCCDALGPRSLRQRGAHPAAECVCARACVSGGRGGAALCSGRRHKRRRRRRRPPAPPTPPPQPPPLNPPAPRCPLLAGARRLEPLRQRLFNRARGGDDVPIRDAQHLGVGVLVGEEELELVRLGRAVARGHCARWVHEAQAPGPAHLCCCCCCDTRRQWWAGVALQRPTARVRSSMQVRAGWLRVQAPCCHAPAVCVPLLVCVASAVPRPTPRSAHRPR